MGMAKRQAWAAALLLRAGRHQMDSSSLPSPPTACPPLQRPALPQQGKAKGTHSLGRRQTSGPGSQSVARPFPTRWRPPAPQTVLPGRRLRAAKQTHVRGQ